MPSAKRPRATACADSACCAIATGWRGYVGTTAVPSWMRAVSRAQSAAARIASMPKMLANQPLAKPSACARFAWATRPSTSAGAPAMSPMPMPIFMGGVLAHPGCAAKDGHLDCRTTRGETFPQSGAPGGGRGAADSAPGPRRKRAGEVATSHAPARRALTAAGRSVGGAPAACANAQVARRAAASCSFTPAGQSARTRARDAERRRPVRHSRPRPRCGARVLRGEGPRRPRRRRREDRAARGRSGAAARAVLGWRRRRGAVAPVARPQHLQARHDACARPAARTRAVPRTRRAGRRRPRACANAHPILELVKDFLKVRCRLALLPFLVSCLSWLDLVASLPLIKERRLVIILLLHCLSLLLGSVLVLMLPLLVWLTPDLRIKKSLLKCNWTIRKRLPRCKMRLKKRLLAFSRRLHARIRKTRYMHKMRCLLINRRSLLLALRLLWKTPIFPSNSRFPRLCAKCLLKLKRLVSILPMTKSKK